MRVSGEHRRAARRERRAAALILALIVSAVYFDVIFQGRSLVSSNYLNPIDARPGVANYGPDFVPHDTWAQRNLLPFANIRDIGATWWQWEPLLPTLRQAIADREWPFWEPLIAGGTPAMANLTPALFFPPSLAVVVLGPSPGMLNAYYLLTLWAAAFFTYLFVSRHDVGFTAGMGAACAVLFGGMMQQHLGTFLGQTAACLPLVLYVTRALLDSPDGRHAVILAGTYAAAALASFPPILVAIFGLAIAYVLVALASESGNQRKAAAGWWAAGVVLALGLVSFYYLPALMLRGASPHVQEHYRQAGLEIMPVRNLYQLLSPTLMGGVHYYANPVVPQTWTYVPYAGMAAIAVALVAATVPRGRGRTLLVFGSLSAVLVLLKLTGTPGVQWIGELPFVREIHIAQYFGIPVSFLIACLAGLGFDGIWRGRLRAAGACLAAALIVGATESLWQVAEAHHFFRSPSIDYWIQDWRVLAAVTVAAALAIVVAAFERGNLRVRRACTVLLIALVMAEGLYHIWLPRPAAWDTFAEPPAMIDAIRELRPPSRLFPIGAVMPNVNAPFGVPSLGSLLTFNPPRVWRLFSRYGAPRREAFMREPTKLPPEGVLDRAHVGVVATSHYLAAIAKEARSRGYVSVFDDGVYIVFTRRTLPRFRFSSAYTIVPEHAALEAIAGADSDTVVLETDPGIPSSPNQPGDPEVRVVASRRNAVVLEVNAPRVGLLYAADSFFDGWTATVNGTIVPILPANYAFRAVPVPQGLSRVEFKYWPPGLTAGLVLSLASAAAAVLIWVVASRASHRRVSAEQPGFAQAGSA